METLDVLQGFNLQFPQARDGYRFSLDPLLLCGFAEINSRARVIDLGTGSGVIPQLLARTGKGREWFGLEVQAELVERARRSVCLNGLAEQVRIEQGDVRTLPEALGEGGFDVVMINPPYRRSSAGRVPPGDERARARFELAGGLPDFLRAAAWLLRSGGRCYIVYLAERLAELLDEMRTCRLEPKRLRLVHPRVDEPARLVLVEGRKHRRPGLAVEPPLVVYQPGNGRNYTAEAQATLYAVTPAVLN